MYRILFFALIMLASGNAPKLMAQFVPGTIYLKLKHQEASAPLMQNYILDDSQNVSDEWRRWISKYNISQIVKPFKTPDPELQKIWRVSFNPEADAVDFCAELMKTAEFAYAEPAKYYYSFLPQMMSMPANNGI